MSCTPDFSIACAQNSCSCCVDAGVSDHKKAHEQRTPAVTVAEMAHNIHGSRVDTTTNEGRRRRKNRQKKYTYKQRTHIVPIKQQQVVGSKLLCICMWGNVWCTSATTTASINNLLNVQLHASACHQCAVQEDIQFNSSVVPTHTHTQIVLEEMDRVIPFTKRK